MGKDQELLDASRTGNLVVAEKLLSAKLASKGKGPKAAGGSGGGAFSLIKSISSLKGANVNCSDNSGDTPLHLAALNGHVDIVTLLLDCGANPTILDTQDCSPLHLAAWSGHTDICSQLLQSTDGQALLNLQTRDGNTALHFAAHHGHINVLSLLVQKGGDPTIRNLEDKSPLDLAAQYDRLDIVTQLVTSHPELVAQRSVQNTPLHLASRLGHRAVVRYLLDSGFPIDAKTDKGTALHEAANFCKLDVIRLLLERGIDISVKSQTGCSAEDILRSIPSRAAEEALNILKTHIYHQRTPDSDVGDALSDTQQPDTSKAAPPAPSVPPRIVNASTVERKNTQHKSLPPTNEGLSAPPPIPPRHSFRLPDRVEGSSDTAGLPHLTVPCKLEVNVQTSPDSKNDGDKSRANAPSREISTSPKNPLELPKKPPRKKALSFRRPDQSLSLAAHSSDVTANGIQSSAAGGVNYVNMDPEVERALLESKLEAESQGKPAPENDSVTTSDTSVSATTSSAMTRSVVILSTIDKDDLNTHAGEQGSQNVQDVGEAESQALCVGNAQTVGTTAEESPKIKGEPELGSSPPTSLDIVVASKPVGPDDASPKPRDQSPTQRRQQPPTPDCPPPSPSTALLNIQRQIMPLDNRRSKDMETITDASLIERRDEQQEQPPLPPTPTAPSTLPRPATKKKPMPLPRKSSLTSETRDLAGSSGSNHSGSPPVTREGYSGGRPLGATPPWHVIAQGSESPKMDHARVIVAGTQTSVEPDVQPGHVTVDGSDSPRVIFAGAGTSFEPDAEPDAVSKAAGANSVNMERRATLGNTGRSHTTCLEEGTEEPVLMRRSVSADNTPGEWQDHVFAGLLRGSVVGPPREVSHQFGGSNVTAAGLRRKRKSTKSMFAPVMEEGKDLDSDQLFKEIDNIDLNKKDGDSQNAGDDVFDDFSDDWDQISATFETFGVGLSRESVFMKEHEDNFAKFLTQGKQGDKKIQSVGSWLSDIGLSQYENTLVANGFDDTDFLGGTILEDGDLEHIGVEDPDHRLAIIEAARKLPAVQVIDPDNLPATVAEWLGSLRLDYYFDTFISHKLDSMSRVIQLWELELVTVLDITSVGHRKRILASLGERRPDPNVSPARSRVPSLSEPTRSPFDHVDLYRDYTGARSRVADVGSDSDSGQGAPLQIDAPANGSVSEGGKIRDEALHLRAPHLMHETGCIKQWRHKPEVLIKGCCNYTAHYLGSTLVKELKGAMSTQEGIAKLKKSSAVINKIPTIMLSISFKGVKFIDAVSKKVVCDHEIANIFCACQDGEHMNFFAYITKDKQAGLHYCHVFSVRSRELAGEIILTLGEAFEIAYQMALKERAEAEADRFDKLCTSDGDDATSVSSKASINTL